ncbi:MAG: DUF362 domain-containing protein [candidate division WOR-3 bacterium]|nr:DUF362 domain-containing protein [candidate division WOR-3 bacterium]MCX7837399.1 DUF362 domain-containing protein [candidate division WOR-3 bacterium]MDW8114304.1 DUF362 domain-containing protein [candidate division WOR-3 bacterium]
MGKSIVYFIPYSSKEKNLKYLREKIEKVFFLTKFLDKLNYGRKLAIKVHFGEEGNNNHLRPEYVRIIAEMVAQKSIQPYLVETSTLYRGKRNNKKEHIKLAQEHGFTLYDTLCQIEILDGNSGESYYEVSINSQYTKKAKLAQKLRRYLYLINLAHFKGHLATGFGGVIKNLGMGLASKGGKLDMHSVSHPFVNENKCIGCGICVDYCKEGAIKIHNLVAKIGPLCVGCAGCLSICPNSAIEFRWDQDTNILAKKVLEYAKATLIDRYALHFNFLINITPNCDCYPRTEEKIMEDIGILISFDPLACDQAGFDFAKKEITKLYSHLNYDEIFDFGEKIGLGTRDYELCEI